MLWKEFRSKERINYFVVYEKKDENEIKFDKIRRLAGRCGLARPASVSEESTLLRQRSVIFIILINRLCVFFYGFRFTTANDREKLRITNAIRVCFSCLRPHLS